MAVRLLEDPFERSRPMDVLEGQPEYQTAGSRPYYTWAGRKYPRVTSILAIAPGQRLMHYSAKVAALAAAAPLVHAGLYMPDAPAREPGGQTPEYDPLEGWLGEEYDFDDGMPTHAEASHSELMAELEQYVDAEAMRGYTHEEAIARACDWADNMLAPDRYRDHKARIGSVAHYYKHELAFGIHTRPPYVEDLAGIASDRGVVPEEVFQRFESWGKTRDQVIMDLAYHALPHAVNLWEFVETYKPEYEMAGLEAVAINRTHEYAGSLDDWAVYRQDVWRRASGGKWPFDPGLKKARVLGDLKTSNYLPSSVRLQMGAYATAEIIGNFQDNSETAIPEFDGLIAMHSRPVEGLNVTAYSQRCIEPFAEAFQFLNGYFRAINNLPRASKGRKAEPAKKGERDCPIFIGGKG